MLKVNLKKLKVYGDRLDDGAVQMSFTFPISASPEAKEAAKRFVEKHGFENVSVATMEPMGKGFASFVVYGRSTQSLDFTKIHVPKIETPEMDYATLKDYMAAHFDRPIIVVGAATGHDAHTVGIDAIMNMKGYDGDYGLERYPLFKAHNLRSQLTNQQLIDRAAELSADAILISQVVTQRDSHIRNLKEFRELLAKDERFERSRPIVIVGGPRLDHAHAVKLGFDAGFGVGTKPSQVASFIVREFMARAGIAEKKAAEPPRRESSKRHAPAVHVPSHPTQKPSVSVVQAVPQPEALQGAHSEISQQPCVEPSPVSLGDGIVPSAGAPKKRRRRGRRGGRRHRRKREGQGTPQAT